jgi:phospholipase D1/2
LKHRVQEGYQQFDKSRYGQQMHEYAGRYGLGSHRPTTPGGSYVGLGTGASVQLCRSASKWSHGVPVEHSIATAYINVIRDSKQFIYIENQFWSKPYKWWLHHRVLTMGSHCNRREASTDS